MRIKDSTGHRHHGGISRNILTLSRYCGSTGDSYALTASSCWGDHCIFAIDGWYGRSGDALAIRRCSRGSGRSRCSGSSGSATKTFFHLHFCHRQLSPTSHGRTTTPAIKRSHLAYLGFFLGKSRWLDGSNLTGEVEQACVRMWGKCPGIHVIHLLT